MKMVNLLGILGCSLMLSCADSIDYSEFIDGQKPVEVEKKNALKTYTWPVGTGQAKLSEHYKIFVSLEGEEEKEIQVLQSDPIVKKLNTDGTF